MGAGKAKNLFIVGVLLLIAAGVLAAMFVFYQKTPSEKVAPNANTAATFASGIYYRMPKLESPDAALYRVTDPLDWHSAEDLGIQMSPVGFDIHTDSVVFVSGDTLVIVSPDKKKKSVRVDGLQEMARPTFSPDGKRVAVQAKGGGDDLDIYVIDLDTGVPDKISNLPVNEESPEWFPNEDRIVYSSFSPEEGVNMHIYDLEKQEEIVMVKDAGAIHLAVSHDGTKILDPGRFRIYDAEGNLLGDYRDKIIQQIRAAGYELDTRFTGQANRGAFPLDGDFSPDASKIIFDGAVKSGGQYGILPFVTDVNGSMLSTLKFIPVNPEFSNNNNFSQLNPKWL